MKAIVLGATGLVGSELLRQLLDDEAWSEVRVIVRRPTGVNHAKLREFVVDFEQREAWKETVRGDVLFSAMGTTIKVAGSQAAQRRVDYDYQLWAAQAAKDSGVPTYVLVSSTGANARSSLFYPRIKGELEEEVRGLAIRSTTILRPSLLDGPRKEKRSGERFALGLLGGLPKWGVPASLRPVHARTVARACRDSAQRGPGFFVLEPDAVSAFAESSSEV